MAPRVLNQRTHGQPAGSVYIGRIGPWGNPFVIGKDGDRDTVLYKYARWINAPEQRGLRAKARAELRGKSLVCWCKPLPCHGDILLEIANSEESLDTQTS